MLRLQDILHYEFLGNPVLNWGYSVVTFLVTLTVMGENAVRIGCSRSRKGVCEEWEALLVRVAIARSSFC